MFALVTDGNWDVFGVDAVKLSGVVGSDNLGVAPAANAHWGAVGHPLAGLGWWWAQGLDVLVDGKGGAESQSGDIVGDVVAVVFGVLLELVEDALLLGSLALLDVVGTSNGGDSAW